MLKHLKPEMIETIKALSERFCNKYPPTKDGQMFYVNDLVMGHFMEIENDITHHALFMFLSNLNKKAMAELKALMWVGRGSDESFQAALKHARTSGLNDVRYVLDKISDLPEYLARGETILEQCRAADSFRLNATSA
jgi:hypothetical protein